MNIGAEEHKPAAFADDVMFFITNPRITLPNVLRILRRYGETSNFKINLKKSEILNISVGKQQEAHLAQVFPFPWKKEIKYLGINLSNTFKKLYLKNYIPLLDEIRQETSRLLLRPLSWLGRVNAAKMILAPKILFKFQMLPIPLPQYYLRALRSSIARFVWGGKKPRISYAVLSRGKKKGD